MGNKYLVKKVSMAATFQNLPIGKPVKFDCREAGPMVTAQSAASRLNAALGKTAYTVTSDDNGATYTVTRLS